MPHPQYEHARQLRREGQTLLQIAEACGVWKGTVSKWCRDMPENGAVWDRNRRADYARRKIFPPGTEGLNEEMRRAGIPASERLRIAHEAAQDTARRDRRKKAKAYDRAWDSQKEAQS